MKEKQNENFFVIFLVFNAFVVGYFALNRFMSNEINEGMKFASLGIVFIILLALNRIKRREK